MSKFWQRLFGYKESQARIASSLRQVGQPLSTPRNFEAFAREGYQKNDIVFACIEKIAVACAGIKWEAYNKRLGGKDVELESHPILDLLNNPNPMEGGAQFMEAVVAFYMLTGNTFIESFRPRPNHPPMELWPVRPDLMKIVPGPKGYPAKYIYKTSESERSWDVNPVTLKADIMHMKSFHPLNIWWGMSPLEAALYSLDQSNSGNKWNLALLQNSATPSGVLQMKVTDANPSGALTEESFARVKKEIETEYTGAKNAGRPMLLEGGLEWKQISMSPKDMEFLKNKEVTAIDICRVFGVPPEMLGLGQKTYANYPEARMSFYEDTILPLMDRIESALNSWLCPMFDKQKSLKLCYDRDDIEALAPKRAAKFTALQNANWIKVNEKRVATGFEEVPGWDVFIIGNQIMETPPEEVEEGNENDEASNLETIQQPPAGSDKPGSKPVEEKPDPEDESDEAEKGWKNFNLLNRNERRASWKRQTARKKRLEKSFARDVQSDFVDMGRDLASAIRGKTDATLIEFALLKEVDKHMPTIKKTLERHIKYTLNDFGDVVFNEAKSLWPDIEKKGTRQYEDWAQRYIKTRSGNAIGQIEETTRKKVKSVVKGLVERAVIDGESTSTIANELADEFENLSKGRSMLIARTEVASASNNATLNAVKSLQVPNMQKEWISSDDDRVRDGGKDGDGPDHAAMDGVKVGLDDTFTVPPDATMDGPGDVAGGASQICNCRCVLVFNSTNRGG